ncbi:unnamed protein product [Ceratitis capitata]|uniref:(Mediterranean fruit fly) hypothetical protein n=1 Tax=Ceratitis capitata TaxID=7213 RepID=A0A811UKY7_CERCA|nr:unnamed protein product [Ceratitis capitata]
MITLLTPCQPQCIRIHVCANYTHLLLESLPVHFDDKYLQTTVNAIIEQPATSPVVTLEPPFIIGFIQAV